MDLLNPDEGPSTFLNLSERETTKRALQPLPVPKSAGTAFFLSLLVPGLGQLYCGEKRRAWWTFFFSTVAAAMVLVVVSGGLVENEKSAELLFGVGLRAGLILYMFAFLDAFYTARELTEGTHPILEYNPRVAAVLNLLTRGLGYWYVDEKKKGVLLFVLVGIADRATRQMEDPGGTLLGLLVEAALAAMAVDAYRIANQQNQKWLPEGPTGVLIAESGLRPGIPLALAGLLVTGYLGLAALGLMLPDDKIDQSAAVIREVDGGKSYGNAKYGIQLQVPASWSLNHTDPDSLAEANSEDETCSASLLRETMLPYQSPESYADDLVTIFRDHLELKLRERKPARMAQRDGVELSFSTPAADGELRQTYVVVPKGLELFVLVLSSTENHEACGPAFQLIREKITIGP